MSPVLGVTRSILGQPWRWRALAADGRDGLSPDDLVTQLLLARGCPRDALDRHRAPSIRGFMPDPSVFRDMDRAAERLADAVEDAVEDGAPVERPERVRRRGIADGADGGRRRGDRPAA